jgi:hypothetical protein
MTFQPTIPGPDRRLPGLAATLALHLALLYAWQLAHQHRKPADQDDPRRIQWINVVAPRPVTPAAAKPPKPEVLSHAPHAPAAPPRPARSVAAEPQAVTQPAAPVPAAPSADQILQQARKDLGKIDRDLRKEFPGAPIKAPVDTPQSRLEKGFEEAAELAPPKWYEAPKIKEIIDPGGYGRKRYRVTTAGGTYCVTYESNHAPDGLDSMKNGIRPKITNCPKDEQPATAQKW